LILTPRKSKFNKKGFDKAEIFRLVTMFHLLIIGFFFNTANNSNAVLNRSFLDESRSITDIKEIRELDKQGKFTTSDNTHSFLKSVNHWEKITIELNHRGMYYLQEGHLV